MAILSFTRVVDTNTRPNETIYEDFNFDPKGKNEKESHPRVSGQRSCLGEWLSVFLSTPFEALPAFLDEYAFADGETDDYPYAYNIMNHFLAHSSNNLAEFMRFIARNKLAIPRCSYATDSEGNLIEQYDSDNMIELCTVLLLQVFQSGRAINRCQYCGAWFVPKTRSDEKYCDIQRDKRIPKTCRELAHYRKIQENRKIQDVKLRRNIRQMLDNQGKEKTDFNRENKLWMKKRKLGAVTQEEYICWLESHYARKYKEKK